MTTTENGTVIGSGIIIDILDEMARKLNFTFMVSQSFKLISTIACSKDFI